MICVAPNILSRDYVIIRVYLARNCITSLSRARTFPSQPPPIRSLRTVTSNQDYDCGLVFVIKDMYVFFFNWVMFSKFLVIFEFLYSN